jgi:hypothetical protein
MQRLIVTLAVVFIAAPGCRRPPVPTFTERNPNGLVVTLPRTIEQADRAGQEPVSVEQTPSGFRVFVARQRISRYVTVAEVELHTEAGAPPGPWPKQRAVRGRLLRYAIDEANAGMGGTGYTLRAWQACGGGYLLWRQLGIEEDGPPPFELAWTLIDGTDGPCSR